MRARSRSSARPGPARGAGAGSIPRTPRSRPPPPRPLAGTRARYRGRLTPRASSRSSVREARRGGPEPPRVPVRPAAPTTEPPSRTRGRLAERESRFPVRPGRRRGEPTLASVEDTAPGAAGTAGEPTLDRSRTRLGAAGGPTLASVEDTAPGAAGTKARAPVAAEEPQRDAPCRDVRARRRNRVDSGAFVPSRAPLHPRCFR